MESREGKILNPATGRWVKKTGETGKAVLKWGYSQYYARRIGKNNKVEKKGRFKVKRKVKRKRRVKRKSSSTTAPTTGASRPIRQEIKMKEKIKTLPHGIDFD